VPSEAGAAAAPGRPVTLGIRPEALRPAADGPLYGEVRLAERLGGLTLLHVTLAGGQAVVVQIEGSAPTRAHDPIRLAVDGAACHVFDGEGRALPALKRNPLAA
jgi:multiple sugar transport system ATP-binding protein